MKDKKVLDIRIPIIKCYPHHANLIACLMTNDFDFDNVASNYIQLIYNHDANRIDFNLGIDILHFIKNYPHVDLYRYKRDVIKQRWGKYSDFAKNMIDNDCYVHLLIDMYYISAYKGFYGNFHSSHNITIYGYDETHFYVADAFENGRYSFEKIPQYELDDAEISSDMHDWLDGVQCWELKENMYLKIEFNSMEVRKAIYSYINSERTSAMCYYEDKYRHRVGHPFFYGITVLDEIINYIRTDAEGYLDIRIPYVLVEQKRALQYICKKLESQFHLVDFETNLSNMILLEKGCERIVNLFLKYNLTCRDGIKNSIILALIEERETEIILLKKLYDDIKVKSIYQKKLPISTATRYITSIDETSQGNWKGKYGSKGYYIIGDKINLPDGVTFHMNNCEYVSILRNKADIRGLCRAENDCRLAAYYLHSNEFNIDITLPYRMQITLYLLDYDRLDRKERIIVQLKRTGEVVVDKSFDDIVDGIYLSFLADEDIVISVKCLHGPDANISAIFFDSKSIN